MNIKDTIAAVSREKYTIRGYVNAQGLVCDLDVRHLQFDENYTHLVRRAVGVLERLVKPDHIEAAVWDQAFSEQLYAWRLHVFNNGDRLKDGFTPFDRVYYQWVDPTDHEKGISVPHVLCGKSYRGEAPKSAVKPVAIAKEWIKEQTELNDYVAKLILAPGKFEEVVYVE